MGALSLIPAPWPVLHQPRRLDDTTDDHGNPKFVDLPPTIRYVISLSQSAKTLQRSSTEIYSVEYLQQVDTSIHMTVPIKDMYEYHSGDEVVLNGTVVDGEYVGGLAFLCQGQVASDVQGPFPRLYRHFGGMVLLRRSV